MTKKILSGVPLGLYRKPRNFQIRFKNTWQIKLTGLKIYTSTTNNILRSPFKIVEKYRIPALGVKSRFGVKTQKCQLRMTGFSRLKKNTSQIKLTGLTIRTYTTDNILRPPVEIGKKY